jgi:GR25 family glycosyltransferase involved in LPS biosynthesis
MKLKYYLIHGIDMSRKQFMETQFQSYGIPSEDVTWITSPNKQDILPEGICTNSSLPKGMVACTYKHYLILKDICENKHPLAVIMEDNIEFRGNVPRAIQRYLSDLPEDWDCVFDSDFYGLTFIESPIDSNVSVYKKSNTITHQCGGASKGAHFFVINLQGAQKLYSSFLPFHECSDHWYNHIFRLKNMNVFWAEPPNVHKINRPSTWKDELVKTTNISWLRSRV